MSKIAREADATVTYLIDEVTGTKRALSKAEYRSLKALGWSPASIVPNGTMTPFPEITSWAPVTAGSAHGLITMAAPQK